MLITNALFICAAHPLSIGIMLILQTITIAIFSRFFIPSFWYSYILILVFLGGLLVLFVYVSTLASNEQINTNLPNFSFTLLIFFLLIILVKFNPIESIGVTDNQHDSITFSWVFSSSFIPLSSFLIIYLFLVLVAIVKIIKRWGGSLRPRT